MDIERLIELAARKRLFPVRRVTYARVLAECPISKAEVLDTLHRVRSPDATAADVRTSLRRLIRALPRAGLHLDRSAWRGPPESLWRHALRAERQVRMARMSRTETADAVLRIIAGGEHEFWLRNRMGWAFTQGGIISRWALYGAFAVKLFSVAVNGNSNAPIRCSLITPVASGRLEIGEHRKVKIGDGFERLGRGAVAQAVG